MQVFLSTLQFSAAHPFGSEAQSNFEHRKAKAGISKRPKKGPVRLSPKLRTGKAIGRVFTPKGEEQQWLLGQVFRALGLKKPSLKQFPTIVSARLNRDIRGANRSWERANDLAKVVATGEADVKTTTEAAKKSLETAMQQADLASDVRELRRQQAALRQLENATNQLLSPADDPEQRALQMGLQMGREALEKNIRQSLPNIARRLAETKLFAKKAAPKEVNPNEEAAPKEFRPLTPAEIEARLKKDDEHIDATVEVTAEQAIQDAKAASKMAKDKKATHNKAVEEAPTARVKATEAAAQLTQTAAHLQLILAPFNNRFLKTAIESQLSQRGINLDKMPLAALSQVPSPASEVKRFTSIQATRTLARQLGVTPLPFNTASNVISEESRRLGLLGDLQQQAKARGIAAPNPGASIDDLFTERNRFNQVDRVQAVLNQRLNDPFISLERVTQQLAPYLRHGGNAIVPDASNHADLDLPLVDATTPQPVLHINPALSPDELNEAHRLLDPTWGVQS